MYLSDAAGENSFNLIFQFRKKSNKKRGTSLPSALPSKYLLFFSNADLRKVLDKNKTCVIIVNMGAFKICFQKSNLNFKEELFMSGSKSKIAITLLVALTFGASAQAMNSGVKDAKPGQSLGAVGGVNSKTNIARDGKALSMLSKVLIGFGVTFGVAAAANETVAGIMWAKGIECDTLSLINFIRSKVDEEEQLIMKFFAKMPSVYDCDKETIDSILGNDEKDVDGKAQRYYEKVKEISKKIIVDTIPIEYEKQLNGYSMPMLYVLISDALRTIKLQRNMDNRTFGFANLHKKDCKTGQPGDAYWICSYKVGKKPTLAFKFRVTKEGKIKNCVILEVNNEKVSKMVLLIYVTDCTDVKFYFGK